MTSETDPTRPPSSYSDFLARKVRFDSPSGFDPGESMNAQMFPFQRAIARWACRRGRSAVWADCGLGKTIISLEWLRLVTDREGGSGLVLTPLAVAEQFAEEGEKFGISVNICRDGSEIRPGINVTNYERLHRFDTSQFVAVVADESSILKDYSSSTRNLLIDSFSRTPYRMACTATPAPNDHIELGNHAEFLGALTRTEMLSTFFVHDGGDTQSWRLKRHAARDFWRWVCSWAVVIRRPSDLGFSDAGYALPALRISDVTVDAHDSVAAEMGTLFAVQASTLTEQRSARRGSLTDRVAAAAAIVAKEPNEPWLLWCDLNDESSALVASIPGAVEVRGSDSPEHKVAAVQWFKGQICDCQMVAHGGSLPWMKTRNRGEAPTCGNIDSAISTSGSAPQINGWPSTVGEENATPPSQNIERLSASSQGGGTKTPNATVGSDPSLGSRPPITTPC